MKKKTAIVVDDSKSARFALRKSLEARGYSVTAAEGAEACYELLRLSRPDMIFMDHVMPDVDGLVALRHIRADKDHAHVPVIICSSHDTAAFVAEARGLGATDVLAKPPSSEQLDRILKKLNEDAAAQTAAQMAKSAPAGQRVIPSIRGTLTPSVRKNSTADIAAQIAELRAQATQLEEKLAQEQRAASTAMGQHAVMQQLLQRMAALEQKVEARLNELHSSLESVLRQQAERTATQAANHFSDQFVNSLVTALRADSFKSLLQTIPTKPTLPETTSRQKA